MGDLREVKNRALEEKNFAAIEHFLDFERYNAHSYFRLLSTFFQKCISFQRATQKHSKEQRIPNIEQLENFTIQTGIEMAKFFRENNNRVFPNRTQDLNMIAPKHTQHSGF